ncbi:MAG: cytochrome c [Phycisphaeraceae bacterium]|nr:cytochrome c [Phycisphaeraceae bacterium]
MTARSLRASLPAALCLAAGALGLLSGCHGERSNEPPHEFLPDMDQQQKYRPQSQTEFFEDGRSMRPTVAGAVAFGRSASASDPRRARFLKADPAFYFGTDAAGKTLAYMPKSAIEAFADGGKSPEAAMGAMIARGQQRFNIYCSVCHGYTGDGKGMVAQRWAGVVPSYHDSKYVDRTQDTGTDGHLFTVIQQGLYDDNPETHERVYRMPAYGHAVSEKDAWAIVAYLRVLQASQTTDLRAVPAEKRAELERTRVKPAATGSKETKS